MILNRRRRHKTYYIRLYKNSVEIKSLKTGEVIKENSDVPFSNSRILIGDFEKAERFIRSVMTKLGCYKSIGHPKLSILLQPMECLEEGVTGSEKRIFRDSCCFGGGRYCRVVADTTKLLSDEEVIAIFKGKEYL